MSLWNHPRLTAALCTVAVLGCAAAPAVFLAAADAASLGRVETVADPYVAPTPTADDYYILRQLAARSRNAESEREQRPAEVLTAPKMYIGASASLQSMQYADSAAAEAAENALRQLAETGAVPAAWAAEALDTAETGESYTDDLEADVQRREDFVGAFTHELKTPMTSIIGYADMLHTMQTDPDEQREAAAAIVHEGRRLEALSRKLLALLGLNEEGVELTAVPLPALWPRLHAACPDVTLRTPAAAPTVRGDADLLLDLLCNLVQNAAKASAPGAPVLVLCAQAGDAVTLTVADRGCGIPPELIPRVTEPFYMVDKSRARRQGGSGLGLALCQRIAAAHGSALRIESEPGRGTRVSVTLPVWKEDAP